MKQSEFLKFLKQFSILIIISFAGELMNKLIPLPFPASIYGLVIMLVILKLGIISASDVREASYLLIALLPLMFIDPAAGIIDSLPHIRPVFLRLIIIISVSTLIVMGVSGLVTQWVIKKRKKGSQEHD